MDLIFVGVDPGQSGGLAFLNDAGAVLQALPLPLIGKELDIARVTLLVDLHGGDRSKLRVAIERVHSMPKQGVASSFRFGYLYGCITGAFQALGCSVQHITPQMWKKRVLHGTEKDKAAALAYCSSRWPHFSLVQPRGRVPHVGVADALCIAQALRAQELGINGANALSHGENRSEEGEVLSGARGAG